MANTTYTPAQMATAIATINVLGTDTTDATATASDILYGKTAYVNDTKITGTIPSKTSSDLTASGATVTAPSGYYATSASKSVATTTHPNPTVSVNTSTGLVTASHTSTAGYVTSGTTTKTQQLTTQAAKTVTPTTSQQTIVNAGVYTTGAVTVAAMPTATQATPSVTVSSAGLITATSTQSAGYVTAGTKSGTAQLNLFDGTVETSGGGSNVNLPTFTYEDYVNSILQYTTTYQYEDGMKWKSWILSAYNTDNWGIFGNHIMANGGVLFVNDATTAVNPTDTIDGTNRYYTYSNSGGGSDR